jgi:hypothetical protein
MALPKALGDRSPMETKNTRSSFHWRRIIRVVFCLLLFVCSRAVMADDMLESRSCLDLAKAYLAEGDDFRAVGEAKRFLFFFPGDDRTDEARAILEEVEGRRPEAVFFKEKLFTPWGVSRPQTDKLGASSDGGNSVLLEAIRFYQRHLRTFRRPGAACPSYPNCSEYAIQAITKHGPLLGTFTFVDRYWREVETADQPPFVYAHDRQLHFDPLEQNDYWLTNPGEHP